MLVLTLFACSTSPVRPWWISVCDTDGPYLKCVNADSVTFTDDDKVICRWNCAELGGDERAPDSGTGLDTYSSGLDLVFQLDAKGTCYLMHAHRFDDKCPAD